MSEAPGQDIIIMSAAVADYTPVTTADEKIKKSDGDMAIPLKRTKDILKTIPFPGSGWDQNHFFSCLGIVPVEFSVFNIEAA